MRIGIVTTLCCFASIAALLASTAAVRSQTDDEGKANFLANCAQCHGADAKGDGPRSRELHTRPADLTLLANNNKGIFNAGAIYRLIDGREPGSRPHLDADMPIWGCRHHAPAPVKRHLRRHYRPPPPLAPPAVERKDSATWQSLLDLSCDSDQAISDRLLSIIGYLSRIQAP